MANLAGFGAWSGMAWTEYAEWKFCMENKFWNGLLLSFLSL